MVHYSKEHKFDKQAYLISVDHELQWNVKLLKTNRLRSLMIKIIEKSSIDLIGEEFSREAINTLPNNVKKTISQKIANKFNIKHCFCDPDEKTRNIIGYPTQVKLRNMFGFKSAIEGTEEYNTRKKYEKSFFHIREKYWLEQINNLYVHNIIFICGFDHLENFKSILFRNGYITSTETLK